MGKGIIIAGFATIGKTFISKKYNNIIDLESSSYKYDYSEYQNIDYEKLKGDTHRKLNENWPTNYYETILEVQQVYDIVFVQLHPIHLKYFDENNIEYYIVYPSLDSWEWVKQRSKKRENSEKWLARLEEVFEEYFEVSKNSKCKEIFLVNEKMSLEKVLKDNEFI